MKNNSTTPMYHVSFEMKVPPGTSFKKTLTKERTIAFFPWTRYFLEANVDVLKIEATVNQTHVVIEKVESPA